MQHVGQPPRHIEICGEAPPLPLSEEAEWAGMIAVEICTMYAQVAGTFITVPGSAKGPTGQPTRKAVAVLK